jgi:hypothetical protein
MARTGYDELRKVDLEWPTGAEFLDTVRLSDGLASFSYVPPEDADPPPAARLGSLVSLTIRFGDREGHFHVHARVIKRVAKEDRRELRFEFLREERGRQELVLATAEGESIPYRRRRWPRIPCELPVRVRTGRWSRTKATATDICQHGMRIDLSPPPPAETAVDLWVTLPGRKKKLALKGRVAGVVEAGPGRGVGVEFVFASADERLAVAETVALLSSNQKD